MGIYDKIKDGVVLAAFTKFGMEMTIRRTVAGAYNENTGKTGESTDIDFSCVGIIGSIDSMTTGQLQVIGLEPGTLLESDYRVLYIAASGLSIEPEVAEDAIIAGNLTLRVLKTVPVGPNGDVMYYIVLGKL